MYAKEANVIVNTARKLVGNNNLSKLSGFDVSKLEAEIESILRKHMAQQLSGKEKRVTIKATDVREEESDYAPVYQPIIESRVAPTMKDTAKKFKTLQKNTADAR